MTYTKLPDKDALAAAIEMEEKGFSFFVDTASKAEDSLAKQVFHFLADEEHRHVEAIKEFNRNYLEGKTVGVDHFIEQINSTKSEAISDLFKNLTKGAPITGGELDAYKFAIDFERKGEAFYKKAEADAVDDNARKLYAFLIGEERKHFKIVEACLLYFENPSEFFHQQEKWTIEG